MSIKRRLLLNKAVTLNQKGQHARAKTVVLKLLEKIPESFAYQILLADTMVWLNDFENARQKYEVVRDLLNNADVTKEKNRRFLRAYVNFKLTALNHLLSGSKFEGWQSFAKEINALDADRSLKSVFRLVEEN